MLDLRAPAGGAEQRRKQHAARERGVEAGGYERLSAPFGEGAGEQRDRRQCANCQRHRPSARFDGQRPGERGEAEECACHWARQRGQHGERERERPPGAPLACGLGGEQRAEAERHAEIERDAPGQQLDAGAECEPDGREACSSGRSVPRSAAQTARRRSSPRLPRAAGVRAAPERRGEHRVGEQVMAAVPAVVPQREAGVGEQIGAIGGRREVAAGRGEDRGTRPARTERRR